jgi:hypothetical protein
MAEITFCQLCGRNALDPALDLGDSPVAERYDSDKLYPLCLMRCTCCGLHQLSYAVDPAELFPPDHPYASGNTRALREHFAGLGAVVGRLTRPDHLWVDVGANDGTLLRTMPNVRRLAVEPTNQIEKWRGPGFREPFTTALADKIIDYHGHAQVITACNVFAHVPDPHDVANGFRRLLADDGTLIIETHDVASVTEGLQIDTIYHEHLRYFSVATLARLLAIHGLTLRSAEPIPTHGGSFRAFIAKDRSAAFTGRSVRALTRLHALLVSLDSPVYGIGATTRATPLIFAAEIQDYISCVCEITGSEKIGLNMPGTSIPVVDEARLIEDQPEYALLFAWHIWKDLMKSLRAKGYKGKFIVPLPEAQVWDAQSL